MDISKKHYGCGWTKVTLVIYHLILMEHGLNVLLCEKSALYLYRISKDWTLIWAVLKMHASGDMEREQRTI